MPPAAACVCVAVMMTLLLLYNLHTAPAVQQHHQQAQKCNEKGSHVCMSSTVLAAAATTGRAL